MDIQSLGLLSSIAAQGNTIVDNSIKCKDEFEKLLRQINEDTDIAETKKFLDEKFNVNTVVVDYSCEKTDAKAEMYDTAMLEKYNMHGGRNVIISKKTLLRMKKDSAFRQEVYKSIKDIPWSGKFTGGEVKGNGVFIHEDGTGGYYLEFEWSNDEKKQSNEKHKAMYFDGSQVKELNLSVSDELNNLGLQVDILISLMGIDFVNKKVDLKKCKGRTINLFDSLTGGEMAEEIRKKYNVTLDVGSIGNCYDFLNNHDIRCTNYVRISPQTLQNMEKNPALKNKVLNAIRDFCSEEEQMEIKALQPPVKSAGMMIYPDGKTLYWLEGYPNEAGSKNHKKIITDDQSGNKLLQRYGDMNDDVMENSTQIFQPIQVLSVESNSRIPYRALRRRKA